MSKCCIWVVTREYAGIAEAGGVKNVACSLSEQFAEHDYNVTLFIPQYGCTKLDTIKNYSTIPIFSTSMMIAGTRHDVDYAVGFNGKIKVVFVISPYFLSKMGVYTYTKQEEQVNLAHKSGTGHEDVQLMNIIFQRAVLEYSLISGEIPQIVHCHDAATSLVPFLAKKSYQYEKQFENTSFFVTIHNAGPGYHHAINDINYASSLTGFSQSTLEYGLLNSKVEPLLLSVPYAEFTTVSPWYSKELLDPDNQFTDGLSREFYNRNVKIVGITNGIDFDNYNPESKKASLLSFTYSPEKGNLGGKYRERKLFLENISKTIKIDGIEQFGSLDCTAKNVFFSYHGRLVWQKGIDIFTAAIESVIQTCPEARFIIVGQGQQDLEEKNIQLANKYVGRYLYLRGYNRVLARQSVAISDFIVLPSIFEPCGLEDFIAQFYGTLPVAYPAGGLNKIEDCATGFLYTPNTPEKLAAILCSLCFRFDESKDIFKSMIMDAAKKVHNDYSWEQVFKRYYEPLFLHKKF